MTRIDGHSKKTTTLADRRKTKNHKPLEAGQTLSQPTGDPKLKQPIITVQPQTPVVTSPIQVSTENIELLNRQNELQLALDNQNDEIDKIKRRIDSDTKKLVQAKDTKEKNQIIERITGNKQKLTDLYNKRADIETQLEKTKNTILKATEPAPAGDPLGMKKQTTNLPPKAQFDKVWNNEITPNMEKAAAQAERNPLTQAVLQNNSVARNRNFIAEANKVATTPKAPKTILGNAEIPTVYRTINVQEPLIQPQATPTQSFYGTVDWDKYEPKRVKTAEQRQEQLQRIRSNPEARARYNRLKLRNNPELKARYESFSKVAEKAAKGKALKKAGKWGAGIALVAGAAYGLSKLFGGSEDKKVETTPEVKPETKPSAPADTSAEEPVAETEVQQPETETPAPVVTPAPVAQDESTDKADNTNAVVAKPETEETEETDETDEAKEAEEAKKADTEQEINEWIAQNGDNYWKYAKRELIFEHQGQADYKPTNKEIAERMAKIMERNGVQFAQDGVHSDPMLKIGDKVKVLFKEEEKAA